MYQYVRAQSGNSGCKYVKHYSTDRSISWRGILALSLSDRIILLAIVIAIIVAFLFCIIESSQSNTLYPRHLVIFRTVVPITRILV